MAKAPTKTLPVTITALAQAMAEAGKIHDTFDEAATIARRLGRQLEAEGDAIAANCADARKSDFSRCEHAALAKRDAFEALLFQLEPQTPSEVLSLALVLVTELDTFMPEAPRLRVQPNREALVTEEPRRFARLMRAVGIAAANRQGGVAQVTSPQ